MDKHRLKAIFESGQSIWLDFLRRGMIESGELKQLIEEDGLRGITSNPKIFEKVIDGSRDYDAEIRAMALEGKNIDDIYQQLVIQDVQQASDLFRDLYDETDALDGYISLEVSPHLAHDTEGTVEEARNLWRELGRPNVFIKVPATLEGLPAIEQLISEGINVNVTLLFGLKRYRSVADAYLSGLEKRVDDGKSIDRIASVASFFLSRIDVLIDPMLEDISEEGGENAEIASNLQGQAAISCAKIAYRIYKEIYDTERFRKLAKYGARKQRLLWASTSTKNPEYSDVKYIEALIGPETVNTMPLETLNAFRDHGRPSKSLEDDPDTAGNVLTSLKHMGIDMDTMAQELEDEGIDKFNRPFDKLMKTLEKKREIALSERVDIQYFRMGEYTDRVNQRMAEMEGSKFASRLWRKDPGLWKNDKEAQDVIANALGWLHSPEKVLDDVPHLLEFVSEIKEAGFRQVVHMGMGGSSLAPMVFERSFSNGKQGLPLTVLDTTDPLTIDKIEKEIPLEHTLFIVASKSGTTSEPLAFGDYFFERIKEIKGDTAGGNFIAITDPGTPLVDLAKKRKYRAVFLNFTDIGGRYSALSYFGLVPVALMGLPVDEILERAVRMLHACSSCVTIAKNPGLSLGAALGELALAGRDKLTFIMPESLSALGMWLEQLLAESTGKEGSGILPVAGEPIGEPSVYGNDRVFAYLSLMGEVDENLEKKIDKLAEAGHPVITIRLEDKLDLAQEFFRWEIATAAAGAILGINAFDQPNVQESKDNTRRLLKEFEEKGSLENPQPLLKSDSLGFYASDKAGDVKSLVKRFLGKAEPGYYIALQAYLPEEPGINEALQSLRVLIRDNTHLASTSGYGPRFLHSTGQYHKGGPNDGLFLQLTADDTRDVPIPGKDYSFGLLKQAQASGDLQALIEHDRKVLRVHLGSDATRSLGNLRQIIAEAVSEK